MQLNLEYSLAAFAPEREKTQIPRLRTAVSGRRYYSPSQGRFLGRDPIEEAGGLNLYAFCRNNSTNLWDYLGMDPPPVVRVGSMSADSESDGIGREFGRVA